VRILLDTNLLVRAAISPDGLARKILKHIGMNQEHCQYLSAAGEEVETRSLPPVISDPKDQAVIDAAFTGTADAICTGDAHFYTSPASEFLAKHGISVLSDRDLVTILEGTGREPVGS
jgi:predicted nucleic acid-binding protein